jgi:hypothetical protein
MNNLVRIHQIINFNIINLIFILNYMKITKKCVTVFKFLQVLKHFEGKNLLNK